MNIVGRKKEQQLLQHCLESKRPEFLAVYGRRRTGKTYLIREYFRNQFAFYATGVANAARKQQLAVFHDTLKKYGDTQRGCPKNWIEAFSRMRDLLEAGPVRRDALTGKRIVFLDELPWMDTARSDLKTGLEYFWNSWGSSQPDLLLIVCGSASSWIINNVLGDTGGLYNRITRKMQLRPFTLRECQELCMANGIHMNRQQILDSYMVFGGIPYYLNMLDDRLSLPQNIDELLIQEEGELHYEYDRLLSSLYRNASIHHRIIEALSTRRYGYTRSELLAMTDLNSGAQMTTALTELEQCGFIRHYKTTDSSRQGFLYQIIDPYTLFYFTYLKEDKVRSWMKYINTPGYHAWCGNTFEILCLNHVAQIKEALGISGVETREYTWRSRKSSPGAQIDLLIDRDDGVIDLCEMKYSTEEYVIDALYERELLHKMHVYQDETQVRKSVHITLITVNGLKRNEHAGVVQNVITAEDLFR